MPGIWGHGCLGLGSWISGAGSPVCLGSGAQEVSGWSPECHCGLGSWMGVLDDRFLVLDVTGLGVVDVWGHDIAQ